MKKRNNWVSIILKKEDDNFFNYQDLSRYSENELMEIHQNFSSFRFDERYFSNRTLYDSAPLFSRKKYWLFGKWIPGKVEYMWFGMKDIELELKSRKNSAKSAESDI